jgi:hypothetical protein
MIPRVRAASAAKFSVILVEKLRSADRLGVLGLVLFNTPHNRGTGCGVETESPSLTALSIP